MDALRRAFLRDTLKMAGATALVPALAQLPNVASANNRTVLDLGPLMAPDDNGIRLPRGFSAKLVARAFYPVPGTRQPWHIFPDGGACFPTDDGGWIYVSNSEFPVAGGVQAIKFQADGQIDDAYRILSGTSLNCAGGSTPWQTWLSCEEHHLGYVWECDPYGKKKAIKHKSMGAFRHEAVAVDPIRQQLYLTEDAPDGCLYRFTPARYPDLSEGVLEVAVINETLQASTIAYDQSVGVTWAEVPEPFPRIERKPGAVHLAALPTHQQVEEATHFTGGEGIWYQDGTVFFTTKGDNRVWEFDVSSQRLSVLYDIEVAEKPILSGVDNLTVTPNGDIVVAEDGGDMQLVVLNTAGDIAPLLQVEGQAHSELTGPAFNPAGNRLYFSSQRGPKRFFPANLGATYEVQGAF